MRACRKTQVVRLTNLVEHGARHGNPIRQSTAGTRGAEESERLVRQQVRSESKS
jgi:hypothetical protein